MEGRPFAGLAGDGDVPVVGGKLDVQTNIDYGTVVILELPLFDDQ